MVVSESLFEIFESQQKCAKRTGKERKKKRKGAREREKEKEKEKEK